MAEWDDVGMTGHENEALRFYVVEQRLKCAEELLRAYQICFHGNGVVEERMTSQLGTRALGLSLL